MTISGEYDNSSTTVSINASGYFYASIKPTIIGGPYTLNFMIGSLNFSGPSITVTQYATNKISLQSVSGLNTAIPGVPFGLVATLKDQFGKPINDATLTFKNVTDFSALISNLSPSAPVDSSSTSLDQTTGSYASGQAASQITFTNQGHQVISVTNGNIQENFIVLVSSGEIAQINWGTVSPTTVIAGSTLSILGQATDIFGNPVSSKPIKLLFVEGGATTQTVFTDNSGMFSTTLTPTLAGAKTLMAQFSDTARIYSEAITVNPGMPAKGDISYANAPFIIGDTLSVAIHVQDIYGNPTPGENVTLTLSGAGGPSIVQPGTTDSLGNATALEGPFNNSGTYQFKATIDGITIQGGQLNVSPRTPTYITLTANTSLFYSPPITPPFTEVKELYPWNSIGDINSNPIILTAHVTDQKGQPFSNASIAFDVTQLYGYRYNASAMYLSIGDSSRSLTATFALFDGFQGVYSHPSWSVNTDNNGNVQLSIFAELIYQNIMYGWPNAPGPFHPQFGGTITATIPSIASATWSFSTTP